MALKVRPNKINFVEKRGIKYLKDFWAVDKYDDPVKIHCERLRGKKADIIATNERDTFLGHYELEFHPEKRTIDAPLLVVDEDHQRRNIGQILTLTGLIELMGNNWNNFRLFSLRETMGFHARLGFLLDNTYPEYLMDGLKKIIKTKAPIDSGLREKARFFFPKVKNVPESLEEDKFIFQHACHTISEYMRFIMRHGLKRKYLPNFITGSDFKFTDSEFLVDSKYLNSLLNKHKIDYQF